MRVAKILEPKGDKVIFQVKLPDHMGEVLLSSYVNFLKAMEPVKDGDNYIPNVVKAVSEFYGVDMEKILRARYAGREAEVIDAISPLYWYTHKLISDYKPDVRTGRDLLFTFRGQKFVLKGKTASGQFDDLSVLEAYEGLEAKRLLDEREESEEGDPNGNYLYTKYLRVIATLCRKKGEALDLNDAKREEFIGKRIDFFRNVSAKTALDIDFFLSSFSDGSDPFPKIIGFLSLRSLSLVAETRFLRPKPTRKRSNTRKRSLREQGMAGQFLH